MKCVDGMYVLFGWICVELLYQERGNINKIVM